MTKDEKVAYWLDLADYDLETAEAMYKTKRWLYVAFMCHQVIEKILKAYWSGTQPNDPPYIHNHKRLAEGGGLYGKMSKEQKDFINTLNNFNIEARYPEDKQALHSLLSKETCRYIIDETKRMTEWIKEELSAATKPSASSDNTSKS